MKKGTFIFIGEDECPLFVERRRWESNPLRAGLQPAASPSGSSVASVLARSRTWSTTFAKLRASTTLRGHSIPAWIRTRAQALGEPDAVRCTTGTKSRRLDSHQHGPPYESGAFLSRATSALTGAEGFEPSSSGLEPDALPLNYTPAVFPRRGEGAPGGASTQGTPRSPVGKGGWRELNPLSWVHGPVPEPVGHSHSGRRGSRTLKAHRSTG
jgi:hypothetical protein